MRYATGTKALLVSCAFAAAAACNSNNRASMNGNADTTGANRTDQSAADIKRDEPRQTPITVTGCLQQGDGHTYILTRVNEPSQKSVGTSGTPAAVEREQLREAANAYRIDPSGDVKLDDMVGKQIRVSGMLAERADLPKPEATSGTANDRSANANHSAADKDHVNSDRAKIDEKDLAKIDATSVSMVNAACGDQAKSSKSSRPANKKR